MNFLYLISIIFLIIIFLLLKKSEKKINLILWIFLSILLVLCYNVFECYLLSLIKIKNYLLTLTIINSMVIIFGIVFIKITKKIQRYYIKWHDILTTIFVFIIVITVGVIRYGKSLNIKYESSDAATHYIAAKQFYKNKSLLSNTEIEDRIYDFKTFMPAAYVNTGICFDIFSSFISEKHFYLVFILFDIFIWYLSSMLFYLIITKGTKTILLNILGLIFTLLYMFAYPLSSMLFGFSYLSMSLAIIEGIVLVIPMIKIKEIKLIYTLSIGFLLTFTLFFSYYLFVPIIYTSIGIYLLIDMIKNRKKEKILSKNNIFKILIVLIIPTILGFCYFILPEIMQGQISEFEGIGMEGYIYRNLYSNFILIGPLVLYYIINQIKSKKNDFLNISIVLSLITIIIMLIGVIKGKVSTYYYFKMYFMFWIFLMIASFMTTRELCIKNETKKIIYVYLITMIGFYTYSLFNIDDKLQNKNTYINTEPCAKLINHIYSSNENYIKDTSELYTQEQKKVLKYCEENIFSKKDSIAVCATNLQQRWIYAIYEVADVNKTVDFGKIEKKFDIESWLNGDKQYYLVINNGENIELNNNENKYKILYNDIGGIVLERINE